MEKRTIENRLADASEIVTGVLLDLDRESHHCTACGGLRARNWADFRDAKTLEAIVKKLDRVIATRLEGATNG